MNTSCRLTCSFAQRNQGCFFLSCATTTRLFPEKRMTAELQHKHTQTRTNKLVRFRRGKTNADGLSSYLSPTLIAIFSQNIRAPAAHTNYLSWTNYSLFFNFKRLAGVDGPTVIISDHSKYRDDDDGTVREGGGCCKSPFVRSPNATDHCHNLRNSLKITHRSAAIALRVMTRRLLDQFHILQHFHFARQSLGVFL